MMRTNHQQNHDQIIMSIITRNRFKICIQLSWMDHNRTKKISWEQKKCTCRIEGTAVVADVGGISHRCQQKSCFDHQEHHDDGHCYQSRHRR
mmetsp:Transcript_43728/g.44408  ORF Transcript_43728/g.44408 Transcript_43728/m.44408 type:complete len:92 (+) Transcript_43728:38-313(+)